MKLYKAALLFVVMAFASCSAGSEGDFVHVRNGQFIRDGKPYYFVGANMWYAAMMGAKDGDRDRLGKELDMLRSIGVDNIRVLVGSDGPEGRELKVEPVLQPSPGQYNEDILEGLDYLMVELARRDMTAVLYLTNSWEWSGGFGQYLEWAGFGITPLPRDVPWNEYCGILTQFHASDEAKEMYYAHVRKIVSRVNTLTDVPYAEDPTVFSWQLCNEPRPFSKENMPHFLEWVRKSASIIKSIDSNHMVSTGSEGLFGCEVDSSLFRAIHAIPEIDYFNIHIWPYNWRWVVTETLDDTDTAIASSREYIDAHMDIITSVGKPLVIEEFGYPRDGFRFAKGTSVNARDRYYEFMTSLVVESARSSGLLAGCNFWAWGGFASQSPVNLYWKPGDDYCGDPAQEQQGLYSVYADDSTTVNVIVNANEMISSLKQE